MDDSVPVDVHLPRRLPLHRKLGHLGQFSMSKRLEGIFAGGWWSVGFLYVSTFLLRVYLLQVS